MHGLSDNYQPFNEDFCTKLEYRLTEALQNSENNTWNKLWCDGILHVESVDKLTNAIIVENKTIITKAWIGEDGQGEFIMYIILGEQSLRNYFSKNTIETCIPQKDASEWIEFDFENNTIKLRLD